MMRLTRRRRLITPRKNTPSIAIGERCPDGWRDEPAFAAHVEDTGKPTRPEADCSVPLQCGFQGIHPP